MRPGFFSSISLVRGSTSRRMKSSAVSFIIRCSSESISGTRMVVAPVFSRRKPPPGLRVISEPDCAILREYGQITLASIAMCPLT